ncbi:hypothetical protein VQ643_09790 [Pseudomonas sp. F1_0610]|uniref:hypothetical protein n=1 Tax=Pseudomonas sp. F1_0610 TaxID=3114284 RepID=UPI0039C1D207
MHIIFGLLMIFFVLGVVASILHKMADSTVLKTYIGWLMVSGLIALIGVLVKFMWSGLGKLLMAGAGNLIIIIGIIGCTHLMSFVFRNVLSD